MPAPGEDEAAYKKRKAKEKAEAEKKKKYKAKIDPSTVEEQVSAEELRAEVFKEGEWRPNWAIVEFDDDACLKHVTKAGKAADGFYVPAGTILPLGAALPKMTVLKYGGYFPAGTSFPAGVLVPLHARMVNILPQETKDPSTAPDESLCCIQ